MDLISKLCKHGEFEGEPALCVFLTGIVKDKGPDVQENFAALNDRILERYLRTRVGVKEGEEVKRLQREIAGGRQINSSHPETGVVKVLFLSADPVNLKPSDDPRIRWDHEYHAIEDKLKTRDCFNFLPPQFLLRYDNLVSSIQQHEPHIVHFSGHITRNGFALLGNKSNRAHPVKPEHFAKAFHLAKNNIRCVVLNACWSQNLARLIAQHIDCVIGVTDKLPDRTAITFATGFYEATSSNQTMQEAFDWARLQIDSASLRGSDLYRIFPKSGVDPSNIRFSPC